jgi:hypothetical protein
MALPWLAGIRAFEDELTADREPLAGFTSKPVDWGIELQGERLVHTGFGREIGTAQLVLGSTAELGDSRCPFVGPRLAYLAFDLETSDEDELGTLFVALFYAGRDALIHRPSGRRWSVTKLASRTLDRCYGRGGFVGGAELLTRRDGSYATAIVDTAAAAARAAGLRAAFAWSSGLDNPLTMLSFKGEDGRLQPLLATTGDSSTPTYLSDAEVDAAFRTVSTELWLLDLDALDEVTAAAQALAGQPRP